MTFNAKSERALIQFKICKHLDVPSNITADLGYAEYSESCENKFKHLVKKSHKDGLIMIGGQQVYDHRFKLHDPNICRILATNINEDPYR